MPGAGNRGGSLAGVFRPLIAGPSGSAVSPRLSGWTARPGICRPSPAPAPQAQIRPAPQAQIASGLRSRPAPDSLIGVEVRAVARQVHQPQLQLRRPEVLPHRFPTVGRRIVPDDPQRPWMLFLQLRQEGNCVRKATEVPLLLLPSSSIHSTSPVSRHTAE